MAPLLTNRVAEACIHICSRFAKFCANLAKYLYSISTQLTQVMELLNVALIRCFDIENKSLINAIRQPLYPYIPLRNAIRRKFCQDFFRLVLTSSCCKLPK